MRVDTYVSPVDLSKHPLGDPLFSFGVESSIKNGKVLHKKKEREEVKRSSKYPSRVLNSSLKF